MSGRRVAVVVLNWNGWPHALPCLESVDEAVQDGLASLIIVDNASTDQSVTKIRDSFCSSGRTLFEVHGRAGLEGMPFRAEQDPARVLVHAEQNGGYSAGNNLGIELALSKEATEYVFLLNNDTQIEPGCIERLVAYADRDARIAILGCTLVENNGDLRIAGGSRYNPFLTMSSPALAMDDAGGPQIDYVAGAAQFIRADVFRRVGLLNEEYFLYFEELDFTRRVTGAGFKIDWCREAVVYHHCGRATGGRSKANRKKSVFSEYHSNLSCLIFTGKYHPSLLWLAAPTRFALKVIHDLVCLQPTLAAPLLRAYRDYFFPSSRNSA